MADPRQLEILQHALGLDEHGQGRSYRNYYVTGEGCDSFADCMALVDAGLMTRSAGNEITGGDDCFRVTDTGRRYVAEHSPPPPKLTASQRRYQDFLDEDSGLRFGEWLKCRRAAPGRETSGGTET